ncbi:MAG: hypothetical protein COB04_03690 [Gammaproteobacteria bacterium]|nr:MAG: hypothetical protein COB04_03690 [Gammaproteobacteria bacterium]
MEAINLRPVVDIQEIDKCHFELVHGCQLRCVGCPISTLKPKVKHTPPDVFQQCMLNIDVQRIRYLRLFNFGETLLHPELAKCFNIIQQLPYEISQVEISTNGQHAYWDDLTEVFKSGRLDILAVSCDGDGTPEQYEALRPPGKWHKLIEFLKKAKELQLKYAPKMQLLTRTICTNPSDQARWSDLLIPLGWTPEFRGWLSLPESLENLGGAGQFPNNVCRYLQRLNSLYIDWDGTVIPCCAHPNAGQFGSLKTHKFNHIVNSNSRHQMADTMQQDRAQMPICGQCGMS